MQSLLAGPLRWFLIALALAVAAPAVSQSIEEEPAALEALDGAEPTPLDESVAATDADTPPVQVTDNGESTGEPAVASDQARGDDAVWATDAAAAPAKEIAPAQLPADKAAPPLRADQSPPPSAAEKPVPPLTADVAIAPVTKAVPLDPATLDGVQPGTTTLDQLHEKWGTPAESQRIAGGAREMYRLDKLGSVRATIIEDVVASLAVHVERPLPPATVAQRLAVDDLEPVAIYDEHGELLGASYPERGVLLGYLPRSQPPRVFQIVVERIEAQSFLARAESRLPGRIADSLADVNQALQLSADNPQAHHLKAELDLRCGRLDAALKSAQRADELEPDEPAHRLLIAKVLAASGDYPQAIARVRGVLDGGDVDDLSAARAWCLWGDFVARSASRDYVEAIEHHQRAIKLAEPLVASDDRTVRRAAKELLLDAHLAVAYDVGWGRWQQQARVVPKWIQQAAMFADDLIATEHGGPEFRLRVYTGALTAMAGINQPPDASQWIAGCRQLGQRLYDQAADPSYRAELAWQVGRALSYGVEIETARGNSDAALTLASVARTLLDNAQPVAGSLPTYDYERGQLCYSIGVVYALQREDHAQGVIWFDRAAPLLEKPVPAAAIDAGSQGETFVSMAVSYWKQENRSEALRLTNQGLKLMERGVNDGGLEAAALAVPYNNLAAMHEALGDLEQAKWCSDLASRYEAAAESTTK